MLSPGDFGGLPIGGWGARANRTFANHYKCYSVAMMEGRGGERDDLNYGGKSECEISSLILVDSSHTATLSFGKIDSFGYIIPNVF